MKERVTMEVAKPTTPAIHAATKARTETRSRTGRVEGPWARALGELARKRTKAGRVATTDAPANDLCTMEVSYRVELKVLGLDVPSEFVGLFGLPLEVGVMMFFFTAHWSKNWTIEIFSAT